VIILTKRRLRYTVYIFLIVGVIFALIYFIPKRINKNETQKITEQINNLKIEYAGEKDITLPTMLDKYVINWESSNPEILSDLGEIVNYPEVDTVVEMKATIIGPSSTIVRIFSFTVKAKTKSEQKLIVTFDPNGGILDSQSAKIQLLKKEEFVSKPNNPTREGYKFIGWYLGLDKFSFNTPIVKNTHLIAKWEKLTYRLILPSGIIATVESQNIYSGQLIEHGTPVQLMITDGDVLNGAKDAVVKINGTEITLTENKYLIERFQEPMTVTLDIIEPRFTYRFNLNGGIISGIDEANHLVSKGTILNLPDDPVKEGHIFTGWNVEFPYVVLENTVITASFIPIEHIITYNNFIVGGLNSNGLANHGATINIKPSDLNTTVEIIILDANNNILQRFRASEHNFEEGINFLVNQNIIIIGVFIKV